MGGQQKFAWKSSVFWYAFLDQPQRLGTLQALMSIRVPTAI
jgi:hypothetical protein